MKRSFFPLLAALVLAGLASKTAAQQTNPAGGNLHPFGVQTGATPVASGTTPATQPSSTTPTTGSTSTVGWIPQPTVPAFPGAALFNDQPPFLAGVRVNRDDLVYREGETLKIEFTAERDAYLYLIYHQADGQSALLFPNEAKSDNRVAGRQWVSVPAAGEEFRFRITAPFGTEVLQVIATTKPSPELDGLVARTGRAAPVSAEVLGRLQQRLAGDRNTWTEHRLPIQTVAKSQPSPTRKANRVGLFVGINQFQVGEEKDGSEGRNARFRLGAELMCKTMLERGGLDPQRAKLLTGKDATRENIEAAVTRWLPSVSAPGDTVFLFYAGHGGLIKNLDGTKPDGKDGVLTTYNNAFQSKKLNEDDWDAEARANWISDIALARWLQELPGRQIVVLVSSCHSAAIIDGKLLAKFGSREVARVKGISAVNVVVMTSCMPDETTLSNVKKPVYLSLYLSEAMAKLPAPVTLQQAFDYYRQQHRLRLEREGDIGYHEPVLTDLALLPIVLVP